MNLRVYIAADWQDIATPCAWALCDETGAVTQTGQSTIAALPKGHECIAIIAAERLTCLSVKMPNQARRRWESALPFVAEEFTLTDPEENHVVPSGVQKDGLRSVWVLEKKWLQSLMIAFQKANLSLRMATPELLLSTLAHDSWLVVWDGKRGFLRTSATLGSVLDWADEQHAPLALTLSLANSANGLPKYIQLRSSAAAASANLPDWSALPVPLVAGECWDWRREALTPQSINLLWGDFAPKIKWLAWLPKVRPLALILLALLFIQTVGVNVQWALLSRQKTVLTQEMAQTFKKAFGEDSVLVNPPLQMQRNLSALRHAAGLPDDADFLALLDQSASALSPLPAGSVASVHYELGRLDIDLKLTTEADLKAVQKRLQNNGLSVRLGEVHKVGQGVDARLSIQVGGVS